MKGLADMDMTTLHLGDQGLSRSKIPKMLDQANTLRFHSAQYGQGLSQRLHEETERRLPLLEEFTKMEIQLREALRDTTELVDRKGDLSTGPMGNGSIIIYNLRKLLLEHPG